MRLKKKELMLLYSHSLWCENGRRSHVLCETVDLFSEYTIFQFSHWNDEEALIKCVSACVFVCVCVHLDASVLKVSFFIALLNPPWLLPPSLLPLVI